MAEYEEERSASAATSSSISMLGSVGAGSVSTGSLPQLAPAPNPGLAMLRERDREIARNLNVPG